MDYLNMYDGLQVVTCNSELGLCALIFLMVCLILCGHLWSTPLSVMVCLDVTMTECMRSAAVLRVSMIENYQMQTVNGKA